MDVVEEKLRFRNHVPFCEELGKYYHRDKTGRRKPVEECDRIVKDLEEQVAKHVANRLDSARTEHLVGKPIDWDLKRNLKSKLRKVHRRTQLVIRKIVQAEQSSSSDSSDDEGESDSFSTKSSS